MIWSGHNVMGTLQKEGCAVGRVARNIIDILVSQCMHNPENKTCQYNTTAPDILADLRETYTVKVENDKQP